jgi:hypothetical protein
MTTFYLGTHQPGWLNWADVPLFVADPRLRDYVQLPRAMAPWALDSGGFTELQKYGEWQSTPEEYAYRVRRYHRQVGNLVWAAPQDWMCEPAMIHGGRMGPLTFVGTGLTELEHQWRTIDSVHTLRGMLGDEVRIIPVVQGSTVESYLRCVDFYRATGLDLRDEPIVGVGSVCRRQSMDEAGEILAALHAVGVTKLHGFGFKKTGLQRFSHLLTSADSLAWSIDARRKPPLPECVGGPHKNCANCWKFAQGWRREVLNRIAVAA